MHVGLYIRPVFTSSIKAYVQTYMPYFKKITILSFPIVIGQLGTVLMAMADVMMVGQLDATNLAAVGASNAVYFLISILGIGTLTAVSPLVARAKGASSPADCSRYFRKGIVASLLLSVFIGFLVWVCTVYFHVFRQQPQVTELAKPYLHVLNAGTVFMLLFYAIKNFSDGVGYTKPSAIITLGGLLLNIFLNWLFIFGKWGIPEYGLLGAGIATSCTKVCMAFCMAVYVFRSKLYTVYLKAKNACIYTSHLSEVFRVGLPSGFQYFFEVAAFAAAALLIGQYGELELAAHNIAINLASTTYMAATGISAAGSILVGDAVGRKHKSDMILSGRAALMMAVVYMGFCALLFLFFPKFWIALYTTDERVARMAVYLLMIAGLFQLSDGIQCVGVGILRGLSDTRIPTLITVVAYWAIGIPVGLWLSNSLNLSLYGIWIGLSIGLTFSAILLTLRFIKQSQRLTLV